MLTSTPVRPRAKSAYRPFVVRVARVQQLSPTFVRVTFTGDDLDEMAPKCLDRRIKLMLPLEGVGISDLDDGEDWYSAWRALPDAARNPLRTYTARAVRQEVAELDVDFVSHGVDGLASAWLTSARPGDEIAIIGADGAFEQRRRHRVAPRHREHRAARGRRDGSASDLLHPLLARRRDDRARLHRGADGRRHARGGASGECASHLARARNGDPHGSRLTPAVHAWVRSAVPDASATSVDLEDIDLKEIDLEDIDLDRDLVWEAPAQVDGASLYAWLAGEANVMKSLRRFLVRDAGIDRRQVAFMGYWRLGHAERG